MKIFIKILTMATILALATNYTVVEAEINTNATVVPDTISNTWTQFENGSSAYWNKEMANNTYSGAVSDNYTEYGVPSYRVELRNTDIYVNGSLRSEISTVKPEAVADERIYNFSTLLPNGGSDDFAPDPHGDLIIAQWHNTPDPGEKWTYPPLALHLSGDGHYYLSHFWDAGKMSTDAILNSKRHHTLEDLGSYVTDKGTWVDWTFHVKWGWKVSQNPVIEVYKNGNLIQSIKGPNTTNDKVGIYQKLGIYDAQWTMPGNPSILTDRVVYYDNVSTF